MVKTIFVNIGWIVTTLVLFWLSWFFSEIDPILGLVTLVSFGAILLFSMFGPLPGGEK